MIASQLSDTLYSRLSNRTFPAGARKIFWNELQSASEYVVKNERGLVVLPYDDILYLQGWVLVSFNIEEIWIISSFSIYPLTGLLNYAILYLES